MLSRRVVPRPDLGPARVCAWCVTSERSLYGFVPNIWVFQAHLCDWHFSSVLSLAFIFQSRLSWALYSVLITSAAFLKKFCSERQTMETWVYKLSWNRRIFTEIAFTPPYSFTSSCAWSGKPLTSTATTSAAPWSTSARKETKSPFGPQTMRTGKLWHT